MDGKSSDPRLEERLRMVETQIVARGVRDERVLAAMRNVPRHLFVPLERTHEAYTDGPLAIGRGQTISQPYVVASMLEIAGLKGGEKVLEVGLGSGYSATVLSEVAGECWSVERDQELAWETAQRLKDLGYPRVHVKVGDGTLGWPEESPFDAIVVTAGGPGVPQSLLAQLKPEGRLVIPVGNRWEQNLILVRKGIHGEMSEEKGMAVRFVPLIGREGWPE